MDEETALGANRAGAGALACVSDRPSCCVCLPGRHSFAAMKLASRHARHAQRLLAAAAVCCFIMPATCSSLILLPHCPAGGTFDGFDSPTSYLGQQAAAAAVAEEEDDTLDVLQSLAALSRQLVQVRPVWIVGLCEAV